MSLCLIYREKETARANNYVQKKKEVESRQTDLNTEVPSTQR